MKICVEADPNTYQYATLPLKNKNVDLAIIFIGSGASFSLISKHLRNIKRIGIIAVKNKPNSYHYIGKNQKTLFLL